MEWGILVQLAMNPRFIIILGKSPIVQNLCCGTHVAPNYRGFSLGQFTTVSYSGSRHCVWRGLQAAVACHGHSGQADCSPIAVAEPVRRETDRHDPTGMSRPHDRI